MAENEKIKPTQKSEGNSDTPDVPNLSKSPDAPDKRAKKKTGRKGQAEREESRRRSKTFKEVFARLLECDITEAAAETLNGTVQSNYPNITADEAIALAQIAKAIKGDTSSAQFIRDTMGEKPTDKVKAELNDISLERKLSELAGDEF
ncbi:MAG: hypothetical protein RSD35_06835 [Oscillospiraceae bacterium]